MNPARDPEKLAIRTHDTEAVDRPVFVYLPGLHGDWTLIASFRKAIRPHVRFVEFTYPRTLDWSLRAYADAVAAELEKHRIDRFWLLGESFGSQVGWNLIGRFGDPRFVGNHRGDAGDRGGDKGRDETAFRIDGFILSGGFVRHPCLAEVRLARRIAAHAPLSAFRMGLGVYARYARFRHRHAPETRAGIDEFIARRTERDRRAMVHRMDLILESDPRSIARNTRLPVYSLAGAMEPVVPLRPVRRWLRRHCPGYRRGATVWRADHNVLGTAPKESARIIRSWIAENLPVDPGRGGMADSSVAAGHWMGDVDGDAVRGG